MKITYVDPKWQIMVWEFVTGEKWGEPFAWGVAPEWE